MQLTISYERLIPLVHDLFEFKWLNPIKGGPSQKELTIALLLSQGTWAYNEGMLSFPLFGGKVNKGQAHLPVYSGAR